MQMRLHLSRLWIGGILLQNGYQICFQTILSSRFLGTIGKIIFFFDTCLQFGFSSSFKLFKRFSTAFQWIAEISLEYHAYLMCWMISL